MTDTTAAVPTVTAYVTRRVDSGLRSPVSKFQPCLPPEMEHSLVARETMNGDDANATLEGWRHGATYHHGGA
jgi:ATP-dependent Lhr-like helicase